MLHSNITGYAHQLTWIEYLVSIGLISRKRRYHPYQKELSVSISGTEIVASERIHELTVCNGRQLACIDKLLVYICRNSLSNNGGRLRVYMVRVARSRRWRASITFGTSEARSYICTADLTYDPVTIAHLSSNVTGTINGQMCIRTYSGPPQLQISASAGLTRTVEKGIAGEQVMGTPTGGEPFEKQAASHPPWRS